MERASPRIERPVPFYKRPLWWCWFVCSFIAGTIAAYTTWWALVAFAAGVAATFFDLMDSGEI